MARSCPSVNVSAEDQAQLVQWESAQGTPQQVALRCRVVLAAVGGDPDVDIASAYGVNRHTAALWRGRVQTAGIEAVWDIQAGRGRKPQYDQSKRDALRQVQVFFILRQLAKEHTLSATEAEIEQRIQAMAAQSQRTVDAVRAELAQHHWLNELAWDLTRGKVLAWLMQQATIQEVAA